VIHACEAKAHGVFSRRLGNRCPIEDSPLFEFEADFVASLRCIPMSVRFKLDTCGIKLSLRQWSRLSLDERNWLRLAPCKRDVEVEDYRAALVDMVAVRTKQAANHLPEPADLSWAEVGTVPVSVTTFATLAGVEAPTIAAWAALSSLQRFALVKLSRDNHDNVNFIPAMTEFGLLPERLGPQARPIG
jgi:hypothetical protein